MQLLHSLCQFLLVLSCGPPGQLARRFGEDAAIGTLNMINPVLIILGLILFVPKRYPTVMKRIALTATIPPLW